MNNRSAKKNCCRGVSDCCKTADLTSKLYYHRNVGVITEWYSWLLEIIGIFTPKRTKSRQNMPPLNTQATSHELNKLDTLWRKTADIGTASINAKLVAQESHCLQLQEADRKEYEHKLFALRQCNWIFKQLKSWQRDNLPPKLTNKATKREDLTDHEKSALFNKYFASVVTDENNCLYEPPENQCCGKLDLTINEDEVKNKLKLPNATKSRGPDAITPIVFKSIWKEISRSIKRLKTFPSKWKLGIVTPIFKDDDWGEVSNYRPVTLLNIRSNVFEKLLFKVLMNLFKRNVNCSQFEFLPGKSVVSQLLYSFSLTFENLAADNNTDLLMLFDFSKAFDKIKHRVLLSNNLEPHISENLG